MATYIDFYNLIVAAHAKAKQRLAVTGAALEAAQSAHNDALDQEARLARIEKDVASFPEVQAYLNPPDAVAVATPQV